MTLERLLTNEEPMRMLALLARVLRMAWTVRALTEQGQSPAEIARDLRLPPAVVETLGRGDPAARLAEKLARCWDVERRGQISGGGAGGGAGALRPPGGQEGNPPRPASFPLLGGGPPPPPPAAPPAGAGAPP